MDNESMVRLVWLLTGGVSREPVEDILAAGSGGGIEPQHRADHPPADALRPFPFLPIGTQDGPVGENADQQPQQRTAVSVASLRDQPASTSASACP